MLKKLCIGLLALFALTANAAETTTTTTTAAAGTPAASTPQRKIHPVFTLSGGYAFTYPDIQRQQFTAYDSAFFFLRTSNAPASSQPMTGGFFGIEWPWKPEWSIQTGVGYYGEAGVTVRGNEAQGVIGSDQTTDYYKYSYTVTIKQLLAEGKLLYIWRNVYHPFVDAGLGASFNKARSYYISNPIFLTFAPTFAPGTTTDFSYRVGFGLDYDVATDLRIGFAYHFADFGKAVLASGKVDNYQSGLNLRQDHLYANELVGQVTLLFF
jgi:opacity protein-like surface antigen